MFDPFGDFEVEGYLRNVQGDKDAIDIKHFEHDLFEANIDAALAHLASCETLGYDDVLEVHRILFCDYYPWAGQDRATTLPNSAVTKGRVLFSHPQASRLAVEHGLRLGQDAEAMSKKPGEVMGLFAYGHPFLDGNGRTILLVHMELCHRAGFSIAWQGSEKAQYLSALGNEIESPGKGILDAYLLQFKGPRVERSEWGADILAIKGLDGLDDDNQIDGDLGDPAVAERYRKLEEKRGYSYQATPVTIQTSGLHHGQVVAVEPGRFGQQTGRDPKVVVWHSLDRMQGDAPKVGDSVEINYMNGIGLLKAKEQSRSRTPGR